MINKVLASRHKIITMFFVFILCINSFSAVVSDNDGSAFITKAEFDSLKNNFQSQLDSYNTSIDSKIDNAISSYLAGISMDTTSTVTMDGSFDWTFPIICMNNSEWNNVTSKYYDYELPDIKDAAISLRGYDKSAVASGWNTTTGLSITTANRSTTGCISTCKSWFVIPEKYNELISISDRYVNVTSGGSTYKAYEILNVGKGRHVTEDYRVSGDIWSGHTGTTKVYWGYSGIIGIGVSGGNGTRANMTTSTYSNWTESQWTRTGGDGLASCLGWGAQSANAFVLPTNGLTLDGARSWAATYTSGGTSWHGQARIAASGNSSSRINSFAWKDGNNVRQWVYTGNSDSPATSRYGWCFDMKKPQSASEKFEGYIMYYNNDIAMGTISDGTWWGFHSWVPHWFWKFRAAGTIGTSPSTSQFSKLPAKQVYYYDNYNNMHFLDEGLFLLNLKKAAKTVEFTAKWDRIDTSLSTNQKIRLKISYKPFNSIHDSSTNLKYKIGTADAAADQQVDVGNTVKITIQCNDDVKQLYMMWEPITSGAYLGLSEISDFTITESS